VSCNPQGQASSKGLEVELLRKKLSAADTNISTLRTDLAEAQQEAAALRAQVQDMESQAGESQVAAEEQVRGWHWCLSV
jgi:septal ring factor EnvC (AmiA/AmiB activator)